MHAIKPKKENVLSVSIQSLTPQQTCFEIENCRRDIVNALRRVMIAEVPCLAIDSVEWKINNTVVFCEHQEKNFSLTPLACDDAIDSITMAGDCECGGSCSKCSVILSLDVKNTNSTSSSGGVNVDVTNHNFISDDPRVKPISDVICLNKLKPGQHIASTAIARKGCFFFKLKLFFMQLINLYGWFIIEFLYSFFLAGIGKWDAKFRASAGIEIRCLTESEQQQPLAEKEQQQLLSNCDSKVEELAKSSENDHDDTQQHHNWNLKVGSTGALASDLIILTAMTVLKKKFESFKIALMKELEVVVVNS